MPGHSAGDQCHFCQKSSTFSPVQVSQLRYTHPHISKLRGVCPHPLEIPGPFSLTKPFSTWGLLASVSLVPGQRHREGCSGALGLGLLLARQQLPQPLQVSASGRAFLRTPASSLGWGYQERFGDRGRKTALLGGQKGQKDRENAEAGSIGGSKTPHPLLCSTALPRKFCYSHFTGVTRDSEG